MAIGVAAADPDAASVVVPDPFGVTFVGAPDFTYQTSDPTESIAYGHQLLDFDSANFGSSVDQFLTNSGVLVDGQPLSSTNEFTSQVTADVIDKLQSDGESQQQILLPAIPNTNIESGVIGIHDFGGGYGYEYIDLVGPGSPALNSDGVPNAIGAFLLTPTGTYDVSQWEDGGDYGDLAYQENKLFDLTNPVSNPFGALQGNPDITYQTGGVFGNTAYGTQTFDFKPEDFPSYVQQFFANNDVSTAALADADPQANIIDKVDFSGLFNNFADQQILLPSIAGTDIDHGVIDIQNLGNGFSTDYIDLVETGNRDVIGEWLVTPMGAFDISSMAGAEASMFDPSYFDPGAAFPVDALTPPFDFLS